MGPTSPRPVVWIKTLRVENKRVREENKEKTIDRSDIARERKKERKGKRNTNEDSLKNTIKLIQFWYNGDYFEIV